MSKEKNFWDLCWICGADPAGNRREGEQSETPYPCCSGCSAKIETILQSKYHELRREEVSRNHRAARLTVLERQAIKQVVIVAVFSFLFFCFCSAAQAADAPKVEDLTMQQKGYPRVRITGQSYETTIRKLSHTFGDERGNWNLHKMYTVPTPLDQMYGTEEFDEYFRNKYGIEIKNIEWDQIIFLAGVLDALPARHIAGLKEIEFDAECANPQWGAYYMLSTIHVCAGYATIDCNFKWYPPTIDGWLLIILHEIAHHVWFQDAKLQQDFRKVVYISAEENFAKFYAYFLLYNSETKQRHPEIWQFYRTRVF